MIRTPLRPLARILKARETGENPDCIEAENRAKRHEEMRDAARNRAGTALLRQVNDEQRRLARFGAATLRSAEC